MKYIGITIGPIVDTIMDASTPAALWFASSIFSDITRRLCETLLDSKQEFGDIKIYSPYFVEENIGQKCDDGIGKYHDRIILSVTQFNKAKLDSIIENVKKSTAARMPEKYSDSEEFFKQYLQIHYCSLDDTEVDKNCVLALSDYLDELELMKTFPSGNIANPFLNIFLGESRDQKYETVNNKVKSSPLYKEVLNENNQLKKGGNIRSIPDICSPGKPLEEQEKKYFRYFAVVSADGDGMGKFLGNISSNNEITNFSYLCFEYVKKVTKDIKEFGGMTIYAGGDDLLFLAPVKNDAGKTIFELCAEINDKFQKEISSGGFEKDIPTVSFGIAIHYHKFPLYEALETSRCMLEKAKDLSNKKPSCQVIYLQKHSGQSLELAVHNDRCVVTDAGTNAENDTVQLRGFKGLLEGNVSGDTIQSILYTLRNYKTYMKILIKSVTGNNADSSAKERFKIGWMNLFDNAEQESAKNYIEAIAYAMYDEVLDVRRIGLLNEECNVVDVMIAILQLKKFFVEKASELEKTDDTEKEEENNG